MTEKDKIKQVLYRFEEGGLVKKNVEQVLSCFSDKIIGIGIGEQGFVTSIEDVKNVFLSGIKSENNNRHSLKYNRVEVLIQNEIFAVVCADISVLSHDNENDKVKSESKLVQSLTMIKKGEEWKICGLHASTPVVTEEAIEAYPLKFAEKTLKSLRDKIGEEAYRIEEQYRQAVLADTIAFYVINFTHDVFEKCQLNSEICAYTKPNTPYEQFIIDNISNYLYDEDREQFLKTFSKENVERAFEDKKVEVSVEYRMKLQDGSFIWLLSVIRLINDQITGDKKGIMYVKNIDRIYKEKLLMLNRANSDIMTDLYNKGFMTLKIKEILEEKPGVFAMLDMDNLKIINDTFGHPIGDKAICAVAQQLKTYFPEPALIGRMGGDEFGIFIPEVRLEEDLKTKLNEMLNSINNVKLEDHESITLSCSIGVVYCSNNDFEQIYKDVDKLLYMSKKSGKNKITY